MGLKLDTSTFVRRTKRIARDVVRKVARPAVDDTADRLVRDAKGITPVLTGDLQNSIEKDVDIVGSRAEGSVYSDLEYAPYVHEILDNFHPNGEAKFIERPFRQKSARELVKQTKKYFRRLR